MLLRNNKTSVTADENLRHLICILSYSVVFVFAHYNLIHTVYVYRAFIKTLKFVACRAACIHIIVVHLYMILLRVLIILLYDCDIPSGWASRFVFRSRPLNPLYNIITYHNRTYIYPIGQVHILFYHLQSTLRQSRNLYRQHNPLLWCNWSKAESLDETINILWRIIKNTSTLCPSPP